MILKLLSIEVNIPKTSTGSRNITLPDEQDLFSGGQVLLVHKLPGTMWQQCRYWAAIGLLVMGISLAFLTASPAQAAFGKSAAEIRTQAFLPGEPEVAADGNVYFKGIVLNPLDEKPMEGVRVKVQTQSRNDFDKNRRYYYRDTGSQVITDATGKFEFAIPVVELGGVDFYLHFNSQGSTEHRLKLDLETPQPAIQYLKKADRNDYRDSYYEQPGGCGAHRTFQSRTRKLNRTKTGFIIAKLTFPVGLFTEVLQSKIRYALPY